MRGSQAQGRTPGIDIRIRVLGIKMIQLDILEHHCHIYVCIYNSTGTR